MHTATPSAYELISFQQCFAVLGKHPIKVIAPAGMDLIRYQEVVSYFEVLAIDPKWQASLVAYNKLKISRYFYNLFANYEFLLTYELDCFVFEDALEFWCSKGYDYIGAPWFEGYTDPKPDAKFLGVGNSGFSLRRVSSVRQILRSIYYREPAEYELGRKKKLIAYIKFPYRWLRNQLGENYTLQVARHLNEDLFFSNVAPTYANSFRVAPVEEALKFSFEVKPEVLFDLNGTKLPMGCHAWWRYNLAFWRPFIEGYGFTLAE
ncbi:hypothetical protein F1C16_02000 [Hymenobacter sp. NBH84]|uniref:DUF5672 family protein n=1 Tax=Hymenobacter sp. NBH84 TaxID=2596915 RepID=UPI0016288DA6|nr:DUF5672 family protein [Hymenobacter sp. NBH84]QNE38416.1 hypothetical protein F1C16_02000 [Hymenobacter sp. NBH84]